MFEHIELLPFQCVTLLPKQLMHGHAWCQEGPREPVAGLFLIKANSQPSLKQQMPQFVSQRKPLPIAWPPF